MRGGAARHFASDRHFHRESRRKPLGKSSSSKYKYSSYLHNHDLGLLDSFGKSTKSSLPNTLGQIHLAKSSLPNGLQTQYRLDMNQVFAPSETGFGHSSAGKRLNDGLKPNRDTFGLDFPAMDVLLTLRRNGIKAPMSPKNMATDMMLSTAAMTARLDRLEA